MLTMDCYTHTLIEDRRSAIESLPSVEKKEAAAAKKTGTDDGKVAAPDTALVLHKGAKPDIDRQDSNKRDGNNASPQVIENEHLRQRVSPTGMKNQSGPSRTRTYDTRIMSPLL